MTLFKLKMHWKGLLPMVAGIVIVALLAPSASGAPLRDLDGSGWTPAAPMAPDDRPTLQSDPTIALAGERTLIGWIDSRNAAPDLYTTFWSNDQADAEVRATNLTPLFHTQSTSGAAVTVEASGRAFATYSNGEQIYLVRYDPVSRRWSAPVQVTHGLTEWHTVARYPQIASNGSGDLVLVWEDFRNATPDNDFANSKGSDIYATHCDGNAMTCADSNVKVNNDDTRSDQRRPRLSRRGDQVAVIWEDQRDFGAEAPQVYVAISNDGGQTWGANQRVSAPAAQPRRRDSATRPVIAYASDGTLFAAWEHHAGSATAPADIYAAQGSGSSWGAPQRVDNAPTRVRSLTPTLAAGAGTVFIAWQDARNGVSNPDIYAATWSGSAWNEQAVATASGRQTQPALAADDNRIAIVWQDARQGDQDIFTATWQGSAWSEALAVNSAAERSSYQMAPALASVNGATYAVFLDNRKGYDQLWLSTLPLGKNSWTAPTSLPTAAAAGSDIAWEGAQIAADESGQVHATWSEYLWPFGRQIQYSVYQAGRWRDPVRLSGETDDGHERVTPAVTARNGVIAAVWNERDQQGTVQLYATWNGGAGWSTPSAVLPAPLAEWWHLPAAIALRDNQLFVAWGQSSVNGRGRIMVARHSLQGGAWSYTQVSPTVNSDWCIQDHPQMQADAAGRLHLVWAGCALRNPPEEWPHDSLIFYAFSDDGAATFSPPVAVGLTIAPEDEDHHNDGSSRPTLAVGNDGADGEAMVLYPSRIDRSWTFYAALLKNGSAQAPQRIGDPATNWTPPGDFDGNWYEGDSAGAVAFDASRQRFLVLFPDRRNLRTPTLYTATYGGIDLFQKLYLPAVTR